MLKIYLIIFYFFLHINTDAKGYALLVGANKILNGAYKVSYNENAIKGVPSDIEKMKEMLEIAEFDDIRILLGEKSTKENIINLLKEIGSLLQKNDVLVFYYSGHGDTLYDSNNDELPYLFDQAFVTYNKYLVDDEMNEIWKSYPKGVKIYQIVDACFSGEIYKIFQKSNITFKNKYNGITSQNLINFCSGLDGTQSFQMYSVSAATKDRTTVPFSNGEGILTNDIFSVYKKFEKENKIKNLTASEFFEAVCTSSSSFVFLKIYPELDLLVNDYVFKLN